MEMNLKKWKNQTFFRTKYFNHSRLDWNEKTNVRLFAYFFFSFLILKNSYYYYSFFKNWFSWSFRQAYTCVKIASHYTYVNGSNFCLMKGWLAGNLSLICSGICVRTTPRTRTCLIWSWKCWTTSRTLGFRWPKRCSIRTSSLFRLLWNSYTNFFVVNYRFVPRLSINSLL